MKKGFTLIELLAVIIILGLLAVILYPTFDKMIKNNKQKLYNEQVMKIEQSGSLWKDEHLDELVSVSTSGSYCLTLDRLHGDGYISNDEVIDPRTGEKMTGCVMITWDENINQYRIEYSSEGTIASDTSGANAPNLASNMIPVMWNGTNWVKADVSNEDSTYPWYNYSNLIWANAVTVTEGSRSNYKNADLGTVVNMSDILTMMVWIPRYEYRYDNLGTSYAGGTKSEPGEIEIKFVSATATTASSNYKIHPAFTFGSEELTGFWVSKFEVNGDMSNVSNYINGYICETDTCSEAELTSKPNSTGSLEYAHVSSIWYGIRSMQMNSNRYGYNSNVDIHMIKNSEWGAVAYLSQSKYGKYGNNDYTGANKAVYSLVSCSYSDSNDRGNGTGACGTGSSTTGTIYGVYNVNDVDTMSVLADDNGNPRSGLDAGVNSGFNGIVHSEIKYVNPNYYFDEGVDFPDSKYYDLYTGENFATACNGGICYGHALTETAGWYNSSSDQISSQWPWINRSNTFDLHAGDGMGYGTSMTRIIHK